MGVTSPFSSRVRRAMLAPVGQAQVFREVRTEDELRQALTPVDVTTTAALLANTGRRIVIAAPITLKAPIEIPAEMPGTVIEAHGFVPITCAVDGIDAFVIHAPLCTLRGLLIVTKDIDGVSAADAEWRNIVTVKAGGDHARIYDVYGYGCQTLVYGDDGVDEVHVINCDFAVASSTGNGPGIHWGGLAWHIGFNHLRGSGTGLAIEGNGSSERSTIIGNNCNGNGIDTSTGAGYNTIVGNANAGTITHHATQDAVSANT